MDNDGAGHVYYGQPDGYGTEGKATDGKYYYEYYTMPTNTSASYSWKLTITGSAGYWSTTCGSGATAKDTDTGQYLIRTSYCSSTGATKYVGSWTTGTASTVYMSCQASYSSYRYCNGTCSSLTPTCSHTLSATPTLTGGNGTHGSISVAHKKVTKNVVGSETKSSTATLGTTLTYNNQTTGNSGMKTGVQAVLPTGSTARYNDNAPSPTTNNIASGTKYCDYYQGYGTSSCNALRLKSSGTKNYVTYSLNQRTEAIGYRPVIVVYKAN